MLQVSRWPLATLLRITETEVVLAVPLSFALCWTRAIPCTTEGAGLKVATWTVQPVAAKPHVAATDPALVWIWYSVSSPDAVPAEVSVLSKLKPLPAFGL